ncbi:MAG: hypothetical protein HQK53_00145 [Oligoflexia bacterium]|nr:hypothetical protein [Oligoflexia bacterium]
MIWTKIKSLLTKLNIVAGQDRTIDNSNDDLDQSSQQKVDLSAKEFGGIRADSSEPLHDKDVLAGVVPQVTPNNNAEGSDSNLTKASDTTIKTTPQKVIDEKSGKADITEKFDLTDLQPELDESRHGREGGGGGGSGRSVGVGVEGGDGDAATLSRHVENSSPLPISTTAQNLSESTSEIIDTRTTAETTTVETSLPQIPGTTAAIPDLPPDIPPSPTAEPNIEPPTAPTPIPEMASAPDERQHQVGTPPATPIEPTPEPVPEPVPDPTQTPEITSNDHNEKQHEDPQPTHGQDSEVVSAHGGGGGGGGDSDININDKDETPPSIPTEPVPEPVPDPTQTPEITSNDHNGKQHEDPQPTHGRDIEVSAAHGEDEYSQNFQTNDFELKRDISESSGSTSNDWTSAVDSYDDHSKNNQETSGNWTEDLDKDQQTTDNNEKEKVIEKNAKDSTDDEIDSSSSKDQHNGKDN